MSEDKELEKIRFKKLEEIMHIKHGGSSSQKIGVIEVFDQNFANIVSKQGVVVIDCWAAWCAPCRMISPVIDDLAKEYAGKILFGKLNVDDNKEVPLNYQIMSVPTILVFKNGILVDRIVGAMPKRLLEARITQHL